MRNVPPRVRRFWPALALGLVFVAVARPDTDAADKPAADAQAEYAAGVRPLVQKYCVGCHSAAALKGGLDLERFAGTADVRRDLKVWQASLEMLDAGEMPPKGKPQPTAAERARMVGWVRGVIDAEARARAGDPGAVPLRRLSNAEYEGTVRDLTGVDLRPTREFPADGAAGEGFANAAEALSDVSPALFGKYLAAAKGIADHAVLLPDGFRFSATTTRRDWTDESLARLRSFYAGYTGDGKLPLRPYLLATVRHRDALKAGGIAAVAKSEKLNAKYLGVLWRTLTDETPSAPLDAIRARWRTATEGDIDALLAEVKAWQGKLFQPVKVGSYMHPARQVARTSAPDAGQDAFRASFPPDICYPHVIPTDEVVCLKMFHREDEPLVRLFLDGEQARRLDTLWAELRFVSRWPAAEDAYLPQFIGYVTQDQPKQVLAHFEGQRGVFKERAEAFAREVAAADPKHLDALLEFAGRAYRRPLAPAETAELLALYRAIRAKGAGHDEAIRGVLARVMVSPAFLFRVEKAPAGTAAGPVDDYELATRLSYFLWSSTPDAELRRLASGGRLHDPAVLVAQTRRMLLDGRTRALATEFGAQWVHVRGFDTFSEKNEALFPAFDVKLRQAMNEEAVRFFQDLFQADRPVTDVLASDATFLNEVLAKHYGIPGVSGPAWRRVEGVRRYGRGGVLGFGSVQAKQAGASRTSPVLRGNWVVETLLGEKLPRPPADVPKLPDEEGGQDKLTTRQQVEKHVHAPACAVCHQRIDPFGFALEGYDAVGHLRDRDRGGLPVDTRATLRDGTTFDGIDGLRHYLLTAKKDVIVRLFCRRLLGYALGRSVAVSDQVLIDEMTAALNANGGRVTAAVEAIVRSKQFRNVRGRDFTDTDE